MKELNLTLGSIRKLIQDFGPWVCKQAVFEKLTLAEIERILARQKLSDMSLSSIRGLLDVLLPFAGYFDRLEQLSLEQLLGLARQANIDTRAIDDILEMGAIAETSKLEGYEDFLERLTLNDLGDLVKRHGMTTMTLGEIKETGRVVSRAVNRKSVLEVSVADLRSLLGYRGIDQLRYSTVVELVHWMRHSHDVPDVENSDSADKRNPWESLTLRDLRSHLTDSELDVTLGDLVGLLGVGSLSGEYGDGYGDILDQLTLPQLEQLVEHERLDSIILDEIEGVIRGIQTLPSYEDPFERVSWRRLDRLLESETLRGARAAQIARFFASVGAFAEYRDPFSQIGWPSIQKLVPRTAELLPVNDLIELVRITSGRAYDTDVFQDLPIEEVLVTLDPRTQRVLTIGELREVMERITPLTAGYEDDFEGLLDQVRIGDLIR